MQMTEAAKPNPIPDTYRRVTPCLVVRGAAKAIEFYAEVFGAAERMRFPGPGGTVARSAGCGDTSTTGRGCKPAHQRLSPSRTVRIRHHRSDCSTGTLVRPPRGQDGHMDIHGSADARFGPVRQYFAEVAGAHAGTGAALAAWCDARLVVDLRGGHAAAIVAARHRPRRVAAVLRAPGRRAGPPR